MKLTLFEDKISFKFEQDVANGGFIDQTESGILIQEEHSKQIKIARSGIVIDVGPECTDVKIGDTILIEPSMWTNSIDLDESGSEEFWVTRERNVIAIMD